MARKRMEQPPVVVIRDLDHANAILREIAAVKRSIGGIEGTMNAAIDRIKERSAAEREPHRKRLEMLEGGLAAFAEYQRGELFSRKRSVELLFGTFGFRRSTEIKPAAKNTLGGILEALKNFGLTEAITVKESVNRDVLRDWPDERLETVGARRVEKDVFWYEPKSEELDGAA